MKDTGVSLTVAGYVTDVRCEITAEKAKLGAWLEYRSSVHDADTGRNELGWARLRVVAFGPLARAAEGVRDGDRLVVTGRLGARNTGERSGLELRAREIARPLLNPRREDAGERVSD